ncbi:hypothetical protein D7B24_004212 [Verticillium nonalfalfae]|uniref:Glucose-methanol-choline oxidoreductase C-terminal domain-containing protein n=1 Tax=Verticillium nonalfalfae TaxID=1051616 RepID=A0A3M9XV79_9PEZI|nr:uncharacterized protein D7B24_004212 [Verticillium nonalfalfae]RNJ52179.1 hypothetical protein D7B24_004212 [Verticillium nonalfalfae]
MGEEDDGSSVVDTDARVWGTDNLYVVDTSIHPKVPTGNTQAPVMVVAEHAVSKILGVKPINGSMMGKLSGMMGGRNQAAGGPGMTEAGYGQQGGGYGYSNNGQAGYGPGYNAGYSGGIQQPQPAYR